jgi:hypothetical protein
VECLDHTLVWDWCRRHGFELNQADPSDTLRLVDDAALIHRDKQPHSGAANEAAALTLANGMLEFLGPWDACLVWATDWDVWVHEEDWPRFYAWRGQHGERRSLAAAPGHVFTATEAAQLTFLLQHAVQCGWDVTVLPARAGVSAGRRIHTSHDEWIELLDSAPITSTLAAG